MKTILKIYDYIEELLIVIGMAFMVIMNFINVVSRKFFANSFSFTEELTVMVFVWITMFGIAAGYKRYAHLGMSYIADKFGKKGRTVLAVLSVACSVFAMALLVKLGIEMVQNQLLLKVRTPAMQISAAWQGTAMPLGGVFILVRIFESGIKEIKGILKSDKTNGEGSETPTC